ncbi:alpha/beta hydrolase [Jatrophihabitans endophyticus]|uniref:alpha/beta hydrolase n=1 Tax=Jatrophihabitans endophyticus TaxID=1206085 RepID=UPI0019E09361|nr:alpha/beta hydrolase [Jatrophihabitans endophyticus]MBE7188727.1 alpha/beta hydrolase [Jatrophihabitans endophyticus]
MPLDPNIAGLLQMMAAAGTPQLHEQTPEQARAALRTLMVDLRHPSTLAEVASVTETQVASVPCRVYRPSADDDSSAPLPTVVYLHGGGFVVGDLDTHEGVCRRLARDVSAVVVSVDYRLAPEHPFPAAVEDAYAVLRSVADDLDEYGGDGDRLVVGGDSAGGNLAAVCAQLAHADGLTLAAQLLVYPAVDLTGEYPSRTENGEGYFLTAADMEWFAANYTGITGGVDALADPAVAAVAADPKLSPLRAASLEGLAPAVVATAEFDPLRDEGDIYAEALSAAGVPVRAQQFAGLIHGFYGLEQLSPAVEAATVWINAQLRDLLAHTR